MRSVALRSVVLTWPVPRQVCWDRLEACKTEDCCPPWARSIGEFALRWLVIGNLPHSKSKSHFATLAYLPLPVRELSKRL